MTWIHTLLALSLPMACSGPSAEVVMAKPLEAPLDPSLLEKAQAVVDGELTMLGPPPAFDAGEAPATQVIEVQVQGVRKGPFSVGQGSTFEVLVVGGGSLVTVGDDGVQQLDPSILKRGTGVRVYARQVGTRWVVLAERGGLAVLGS